MLKTVIGGWPARGGSSRFTKALLVMKLTMILLTVGFLNVSASGISQNVTFSGKNVPLEKVFAAVKQQTGYVFLFPSQVLDQAKPITVEAENMPLAEFLQLIFKNQSLKYSIDSKTINVSSSSGSFSNPTSSAVVVSSDQLLVSPIKVYITDEDGQPAAGVTVTIKGTDKATITNTEGVFSINVFAGDVLLFTSVEYESSEYKITPAVVASSYQQSNGKKWNIALTLRRKITALHDVTVNKGYYTIKDELNTGNVFTVKGDDIKKQPVSDPILALEGRVPGLMISQTNGLPGSTLDIQLRGKNFFPNLGGFPSVNNPLYIVDGIPYSSQSFLVYNFGTTLNVAGDASLGLSPFSMLNTSDIESIEVLKDADATAIYGSRGANGVIIINTKKGKSGKTKVDLNFSQGYSKQTTITKLLNTKQYLEMRHEAFKNDGLVSPSIIATPNDRNFDINGAWDTTRYTNWYHELLSKPAAFINAQGSISGGNPNTKFLIAGRYIKQGTYFPGGYTDQKGSLHFDIGHNSVDQRFYIDLSGTYLNDNNTLPGGSAFVNINQYAPDAPAIYDPSGNLNWQMYKGSATWRNPLAALNVSSKILTSNLTGNLVLNYRITSGLIFKTNFSYQVVQSTQKLLSPSTFNPPPLNADPNRRTFSFSNTNNQTWDNETQLSYNAEIGKWNFETLIGTTIQDSKGNSVAYNASGYSSDALITNVRSASTFNLNYTASPEYKFNSLYVRMGVDWDKKYIINVTARRDGSSRFGPGKQFGDFGAAAIGWIFSKENFVKNYLPWLSFGKIHSSYGVTGSDGIGDYGFLSTYSSDNSYTGTYLGLTALSPSALTDPNYRWQRAKKLEGGIELGFLKDRINTTIVYYRNRSDNQLIAYTLAYTTGFPTVITNFPPLIQNSGWEFTLSTSNIRSRNLSWNTSFNLSIPENRLISYPGLESSPYSSFYSVGKSIFSKFVTHYIGVGPQTGMYTFATKNSSGVPSFPNDYVWSKPVTQQFYGGMGNKINYKGFSVDLFIQFVKQNGYSYQKVFNTSPGFNNNNQPEIVMDRWQKPGDKTNIQRFTTGAGAGNVVNNGYRYFLKSDGIITDASFIRFKTLKIAYGFSNEWIQKVHLQNAEIYLQCQNLFTITRYQILDPETQNILSPVKTLTAGIQLTF